MVIVLLRPLRQVVYAETEVSQSVSQPVSQSASQLAGYQAKDPVNEIDGNHLVVSEIPSIGKEEKEGVDAPRVS